MRMHVDGGRDGGMQIDLIDHEFESGLNIHVIVRF